MLRTFQLKTICSLLPLVWASNAVGYSQAPALEKESLNSNQKAGQRLDSKQDHTVTPSCQLPVKRLYNEANRRIPTGERILDFDYSDEISESKTLLSGNVTLRNSQTTVRAEKVIIDNDNNQIQASGDVNIESKSTRFKVDSLSQDGQSQKMELDNGEFSLLERGAQGTAQSIQVSAGEATKFTELTYSSCPKGDEDWQLSMSELELNPLSGRGEAYHTTFRVADVPVFYLPYLTFPIDSRRQSGLLFPALENDDKNGMDYTQPIYWNIAPWIDTTIRPRWIEKRGSQLGAELRWMTQNSYSQWEFEYLDNDKVVAEQIAQTSDPSLIDASAKRWQSAFKYQAKFNQNWQLKVDSTRVSDSEYFRDFGSGLESSNKTYLESRAHLNYADPVWDIDLFAEADQSLIGQGIYRLLPSLQVSAYNEFAGFEFDLEGEWTEFSHPSESQIVGSRRHIAPSVSYKMENEWGQLTPKFSYWSTHYKLENPLSGTENDYSRNVSVFSLDGSMTFEKQYKFNEKDYSHLVTPRFFYAYIPYEEQQNIHRFDTLLPQFGFRELWQENRFVGIDRIGDTNHLSVELANSWVNSDSGERLVYFNLGRRVYFEDRLIDLYGDFRRRDEASPWIAELDWQVTDSLSVNQFIEWQQDADHTKQAYTRIKFEPSANHIVNLTHRYRDIGGNQVEESDLSFSWPLNSQWRLVGRWYNDNSRSQIIESMAGFEYESCCWAMRIVAQKYLNMQLGADGLPLNLGFSDEYTSGVHFQFIFKGLGSAGKTGLGNMLETGIPGYRDRFGN